MNLYCIVKYSQEILTHQFFLGNVFVQLLPLSSCHERLWSRLGEMTTKARKAIAKRCSGNQKSPPKPKSWNQKSPKLGRENQTFPLGSFQKVCCCCCCLCTLLCSAEPSQRSYPSQIPRWCASVSVQVQFSSLCSCLRPP